MADVVLSTDGLWQSRNGRKTKVEVIADDVARGNVAGKYRTWTLAGVSLAGDRKHDIVGRWEQPTVVKVQLWLWLYADGSLVLETDAPTADDKVADVPGGNKVIGAKKLVAVKDGDWDV